MSNDTSVDLDADAGVAFERFSQAIDIGNDARTEQASDSLTPADQRALLAMLATTGVDMHTRDMHWWAIRTLARIGDAGAIAPVASALSDSNAMTRAAAALAIGHLAQRHPESDDTVPALHALGRCFADDDGVVRQQAVEGMALAGVQSLPVLEQLLSQRHLAVVRVRAAASLRHMRDVRCARLLFPLLNDSNHLVHTYAYEALEDLGLLDNVLLSR